MSGIQHSVTGSARMGGIELVNKGILELRRFMTHEESWHQSFELLKAYIEEHHHLPDKKKVENRGLLSWAKYQRKRIKAGTLDEEKTRMFEELMESRSKEHTEGKRKKCVYETMTIC